jgi:NRPS condensation-like uncharacterized protein
MRTLLILIPMLILLGGCYPKHEEKDSEPPDDLIEVEKMANIIAEVEIAESALRQKQNYGHEIRSVKEEYYTAIFKKYEVTKDQFDRSLAYYKKDLETIDAIYEQVITRLSVIESEVQHE